MAPGRPSRGFTLVELLVAIAILAVLAGLAMVAVSMIKKRQDEVRAVHELEQVASAVSAYLGDYPMLGDPALSGSDVPDFARRPLVYLVDRPVAAGKPAYLEPARSRQGDVNGQPLNDRAGTGVRLLDPFRAPFRWAVINEPVGKERFTRAVAVLCRCGTPGRQATDIIWVWRNEDGRWRRLKWADLYLAESKDAGTRTREEEDLVQLKAAFTKEKILPP
jgi:prepilin-type N-terminal cleavage/methylation domain-containing protein